MKLNLDKLFDNKRFLIILSVVLAVTSWITVVRAIDSEDKYVIENIPVDITESQTEALKGANLNIVEGATLQVNATVQGQRYIIGALKPADIEVRADFTGVTDAGSYDLKLIGRSKGKEFEVLTIDPPNARIRLDRLTTKTIKITTDIQGLEIPENYLGLQTIVSPEEVKVTGPDADVSKIDKCVATVVFEEPLTKNTTRRSELTLLNSEGVPINLDSVIMDSEFTDITVPVYKQKTLSVVFEYLSPPPGFPLHMLDYTLTIGGIDVAGPEDLIDTYPDTLNIGYVSLSEITEGWAATFPVSLPDGFINVSNVKSIGLTFNLEDVVAANFKIPGENISVINVPVNYEVTVVSSSLNGVRMLGDKEVLETLSAQDLVAVIDLSEREISPGSYSWPVHVYAPDKQFAWATGDITAVINIKEKS